MHIAVSGCPRDNGISYTEGTLASIIAAGAECPISIFDDVNWIGSAKACHELIKDVYRDFPGEDVLLLEDDVIACRNAVEAARRVPFPADCEMLSFFQCRKRYCERAPKGIDFRHIDVMEGYKYRNAPILKGIHLVPANERFMYVQATKLTPRLVEHIATTKWPDDASLGLTQEELAFMAPYSIRDKALGYFAGQVGKWIGQVAPNWFEHVGVMSAATALQFRTQRPNAKRAVIAGNWQGPEHDALTDDVSKVFPA